MQATNSMPVSTITFLDECHSLVIEHLRPHIKKMFENCDTAFTDFAGKAQSNAIQSSFFEAMAVVRRNRGDLEKIFYRELGRSFADFGSGIDQPKHAGATEADSLTLVSKDDMDIQTARQNMVISATTGSAQVLAAMRQRLAALNHGQKLREKDIPGGPRSLDSAYHLAASSLVIEHQALLILYMLFNKFVMGTTDQLYYDYNKHLLKAGLLPNLKYEVRIDPSKAKAAEGKKAVFPANKSGRANSNRKGNDDNNADVNSKTDSNNTGSGNGNSGQSLGDELFGDIMQLLSRRDSGKQGQQQATISNPIPQTELVSTLHQLQQNTNTVINTTKPVDGIKESRQLVANLISNLSAERDRLYEGIDRRRLPVADTQVIDLVGMMFEYMLKDEGIPSVAKAELSRLHTPYLKVAILDKELFTNTSHPAHELLNSLARAAACWVIENDLDRGIFPSIHNVVERIIDEFENNTDIFSELLTLFRANVDEIEIKSTVTEKRTRQAAEGKEKLSLARDHATIAIKECMEGHEIPAPISQLLYDVWQDKLMFIYLREPESSKSYSWQLAVRAIKAIIWSVEPRTSEEAQSELHEKLPETRKQIEHAIETLQAYGSNKTETQLALIRDTQEANLCAPVSASSKPSPADPGHPEADNNETTDNASDAGSTDEQPSPEVEAAMKQLEKIAFGTWFSIQ
ncbi:MAG: DUF1631 domain-containing protein, partial [Gammaproteobacteria bacterium]|nr:DUF1631 domain-containing protein [Gammaproteobacteria bacterium]